MNHNFCAGVGVTGGDGSFAWRKRRVCPVEQPLCLIRAHVDAAMTHRCSKVVVPICAVYGVTAKVVHGIRNVSQVITDTSHICGDKFLVYAVFSRHGWVLRQPCGYCKLHNRLAGLMCRQLLVGQVDFYPLVI